MSTAIGNSSVPNTVTALLGGKLNSTPSATEVTSIEIVPISPSATSARVPPPPRLTALTLTNTGSCATLPPPVAKLFGKTILASKASFSPPSVFTEKKNLSFSTSAIKLPTLSPTSFTSCIPGITLPLASTSIRPRSSRYSCKLSLVSSAGRVKYTKNVPTISPPVEDADTRPDKSIPPVTSSVPVTDKSVAKFNVGASATALISNVKLPPSAVAPKVVASVLSPCDVVSDNSAVNVPAVLAGGINKTPERLKFPFASTPLLSNASGLSPTV